MKVLYVASRANADTELNLTREITELQRRFGREAGERVEFRILPDLKVEDLPSELSTFLPEILHIASHAEKDVLSLSDQSGAVVKISAKMLAAFLPPESPPRLIYLNSCNSEQIANSLTADRAVAFAIGSTAPITNRVARNSAVAFYERLLAGYSLEHAYDACRYMLEATSGSSASVKLFASGEGLAVTEIMHRVPMLIADFENLKQSEAERTRKEGFDVRLGLAGCPAATIQVIFFTDDESYFESEDTYEDDLCLVVRTSPVKGLLWAPEDSWNSEGDHRLFAVGVLAGGGCFSVAGTLCEAIENRYRFSPSGETPETVVNAIRRLKENDGSDLTPKIFGQKKVKKQTSKKEKKRAGR
jgi:hypothetical protein